MRIADNIVILYNSIAYVLSHFPQRDNEKGQKARTHLTNKNALHFVSVCKLIIRCPRVFAFLLCGLSCCWLSCMVHYYLDIVIVWLIRTAFQSCSVMQKHSNLTYWKSVYHLFAVALTRLAHSLCFTLYNPKTTRIITMSTVDYNTCVHGWVRPCQFVQISPIHLHPKIWLRTLKWKRMCSWLYKPTENRSSGWFIHYIWVLIHCTPRLSYQRARFYVFLISGGITLCIQRIIKRIRSIHYCLGNRGYQCVYKMVDI